MNTPAQISRVYVYSLEQDKSFPVTDGLTEATEPVFDASGKYLYFLSSNDTGMSKHGFSQSAADSRAAAVVAQPRGAEGTTCRVRSSARATRRRARPSDRHRKVERVPKKDAAFADRLRGTRSAYPVVPAADRELRRLEAGAAGRSSTSSGPNRLKAVAAAAAGGGGGATLHRYDLDRRRDATVQAGVGSYELTPDGRKMLYSTRRELVHHLDRGRRRRTSRPDGGRRSRAWWTADRAGTESGGRRERRRKTEPRQHRGSRRSAGRVEANLRRSVAHQPRLLLRPEHARGRLAGHEEEVRTVPAARDQQRATSTASSAGCSANWRSATAATRPASGCTSARPCRAGCSGRTTRSPTAATASRRSTAG